MKIYQFFIGLLVLLSATAALAANVVIAPEGPIQYQRYNGETGSLSYTFKVTNDTPSNLYLSGASAIEVSQGLTVLRNSTDSTCGLYVPGQPLPTPLAPRGSTGDSCTLVYTSNIPVSADPNQTKNYSAQLAVKDSKGSGGLAYSTNFGVTVIGGVYVSGTVSTPLPTNSPEGVTQPVAFTYTNGAAGSATGVSVTVPTLAGLSWTTSSCPTPMAVNAVCTLSGTYTPPVGATGNITIAPTFSYTEGAPIKLSTSTTVVDISVNGTVSTPLPTNSPEEVSQPVAFTYTNSAAGSATGVSVTVPTIAGLSWTTSSCPATMTPNAVCTLSGTYTPPAGTTGNITIAPTFSYTEGAPINLSTSTTVVDISVNGTVSTPLPTNSPEGVSQPVAFTYTNGAVGSATGVSVTVPTIAGLSWTTSSCPATMAVNAVCTLSGTYTPPVGTTGIITIAPTFSYTEGAPINLSTSTTVANISVSGTVSTPLPSNSPEGVAQPVAFTYTNGAVGSATGVSVTVPTIAGLSWTTSSCPTPMTPNAVCTLSGTYTPPADTTGNITIAPTFSYTEGAPINLSTSTTVVAPLSAFIVNSHSDTVTQCTVNPTSGAFTNCADTGATGLSTPQGIVLNKAGTRAFIPDTSNIITQCTVNPTSGAFTNCANTGATALDVPRGIAFNATGTRAFIANASNSTGSGTVTQCTVNPTSGAFTNCADTGAADGGSLRDIVLNATDTRAFITVANGNRVIQCTVNPTSGAFTNCANTGATGLNIPRSIALNATGTRAFITTTGNGNVIIQCTVNTTSGAFTNCADTGAIVGGLDSTSMVLNATGTRAFITDATNTITQCTVNTTSGAFTNCTTTSGPFNYPFGITLVYRTAPSQKEATKLGSLTF